MTKVKSQHANFAVKFAKSDPAVRSAGFIEVALKTIRDLEPLYRAGAEPGYAFTRS